MKTALATPSTAAAGGNLASAIASVRAHADQLHSRLTELKAEAKKLAQDRHEIEFSPLNWPDREAMLEAMVDDASARYVRDAEHFIRKHGIDLVALQPINFQRLAFSGDIGWSEADGELSWGWQCFAASDVVKAAIAKLVQPFVSEDGTGLSLAERRGRVDAINGRLTEIKEESARLVVELRALNPATTEETS